ncbi:hypothetical protein RCL1_004864 [Eukaryota sp. TZLM3-RCL]
MRLFLVLTPSVVPQSTEPLLEDSFVFFFDQLKQSASSTKTHPLYKEWKGITDPSTSQIISLLKHSIEDLLKTSSANHLILFNVFSHTSTSPLSDLLSSFSSDFDMETIIYDSSLSDLFSSLPLDPDTLTMSFEPSSDLFSTVSSLISTNFNVRSMFNNFIENQKGFLLDIPDLIPNLDSSLYHEYVKKRPVSAFDFFEILEGIILQIEFIFNESSENFSPKYEQSTLSSLSTLSINSLFEDDVINHFSGNFLNIPEKSSNFDPIETNQIINQLNLKLEYVPEPILSHLELPRVFDSLPNQFDRQSFDRNFVENFDFANFNQLLLNYSSCCLFQNSKELIHSKYFDGFYLQLGSPGFSSLVPGEISHRSLIFSQFLPEKLPSLSDFYNQSRLIDGNFEANISFDKSSSKQYSSFSTSTVIKESALTIADQSILIARNTDQSILVNRNNSVYLRRCGNDVSINFDCSFGILNQKFGLSFSCYDDVISIDKSGVISQSFSSSGIKRTINLIDRCLTSDTSSIKFDCLFDFNHFVDFQEGTVSDQSNFSEFPYQSILFPDLSLRLQGGSKFKLNILLLPNGTRLTFFKISEFPELCRDFAQIFTKIDGPVVSHCILIESDNLIANSKFSPIFGFYRLLVGGNFEFVGSIVITKDNSKLIYYNNLFENSGAPMIQVLSSQGSLVMTRGENLEENFNDVYFVPINRHDLIDCVENVGQISPFSSSLNDLMGVYFFGKENLISIRDYTNKLIKVDQNFEISVKNFQHNDTHQLLWPYGFNSNYLKKNFILNEFFHNSKQDIKLNFFYSSVRLFLIRKTKLIEFLTLNQLINSFHYFESKPFFDQSFMISDSKYLANFVNIYNNLCPSYSYSKFLTEFFPAKYSIYRPVETKKTKYLKRLFEFLGDYSTNQNFLNEIITSLKRKPGFKNEREESINQEVVVVKNKLIEYFETNISNEAIHLLVKNLKKSEPKIGVKISPDHVLINGNNENKKHFIEVSVENFTDTIQNFEFLNFSSNNSSIHVVSVNCPEILNPKQSKMIEIVLEMEPTLKTTLNFYFKTNSNVVSLVIENSN